MSHDRIVAMYFFASLTFLVVGLSLSMFTQTVKGYYPPFNHEPTFTPILYTWTTHPYEDLGWRLFGFGIFLVAATFYQSLVGQKKREPLKGNTFGVIE